MRAGACLSLALTGCQLLDGTGYPTEPIRLRAEGPPAFVSAVIRAQGEWDEALEAWGCVPPLVMDPMSGLAHRVRLLEPEDWHWIGDGYNGMTYGIRVNRLGWLVPDEIEWDVGPGATEDIYVEDDTERAHDILLHELGHALGLEHTRQGDGRGPSIMSPWGSDRLWPRDVWAARAVLDSLGGCGPAPDLSPPEGAYRDLQTPSQSTVVVGWSHEEDP